MNGKLFDKFKSNRNISMNCEENKAMEKILMNFKVKGGSYPTKYRKIKIKHPNLKISYII